uniref:hypothetical protein n=1 Tax=Cephaloticoccus sp. TaxID=1985742 RepID=UPI0040493C66
MQAVFQKGKLILNAGVFSLGPGKPALRINGGNLALRCVGGDDAEKQSTLNWRGRGVGLTQRIERESQTRIRITHTLTNTGATPHTLNEVILFASRQLGLGPAPADTRILEQNAYMGRVRTPRQMLTGSDQLAALDGTTGAFVSHNHTVFYNHSARSAVLLGFETIDRWLPQISARMFAETGGDFNGMENVDGGVTSAHTAAQKNFRRVPAFREFTISFDGGDYRLDPGETLALGDFVVETGSDPLALLDAHGLRIKRRNRLP